MIRREDFLYEKSGVSRPWQFDDALRREVGRARRYGSTFSFVLVGIDNPESLREQIGPERMGVVVSRVGELLGQEIRFTDLIGHHADGQIGALLPETPIEGAYLVAERLRASVVRTALTELPDGAEARVSVGVSAFRDDPAFGVDALIYEAEKALAAAQREGGNRSRVFMHVA